MRIEEGEKENNGQNEHEKKTTTKENTEKKTQN